MHCVELQVPWAGRSASEIITDVGERKFSLPLQRDRIPLLVYRTLRQGLVWEVERRDLELGEIRDMMLLSRVQQDRTLICIQKKAARQQDDQDQENSKIPQTDQQIKPNVPRNRSLFAELSTVSKSAIQTDIKKYLLIDSDISEDEVEIISLNSSMTNKVGCCSSYPLINISKVNQDCVQNRDTDYSSSTDMSENFSVDAESFRGKGPRFDPRVEKQGRKITLSAPNLRKKSFNDIRKPVPTGTYLKLWRGSREPSPRRNESKKKGKLQSLRTGQVLEKEEQTRPGRGRVRDSVRFFESLISPPASPGWEEFHSAFEAMQVVGDADSGLGEGVLNTTAAATLSSFLQPSVIQQNRPGHGRSFSPASKPRCCALVESTSTNFSLLQRSNNSYSNDLSSVGCSPALIPSAPIKSESLLRKSLSVSSSPDSPAAAVDGSQVDFAVSDTRQTTFTTALSEATVEESADVSTNSALFLTANGSDVTIDTVKRSPLVVTFNTGVEENTTSIVSLSSDSDMVVTNTLVTTEDISNADELHPYLALEMVTGSGDPGSVVNSCRDEEERYEIADPLPLCMSQSSRDENLDSPEQTDITEDSAWQEGDTCLFQHSKDQGWYEANISHISLAEPTLVFDGGMVQLKPLEALKKILINGLAGSVDILESRGVMKNCEEIELRTHVDDLELGISKEEVDWMEGNACIARLVFKLCRAMVQCLCRWEEEVGRGWKRRWEEDDFWYEAVVDKVKADQAVVTFTHYGNSAIFHVADLKKKETPIDDSR